MGANKKPVGRRGDWFADWDGLLLPCVHKYWWKQEGKTAWYEDPGYLAGDRLWIQLIEGLKEKRSAILTSDEPTADASKLSGISFVRTGYIGVYEIGPIEIVSEHTLRFQFLKRIHGFI